MARRTKDNSRNWRRRIIGFPPTRIMLALLIVILPVAGAQAIVAAVLFDGEADLAGRVGIAAPGVASLPFGLAWRAVLSAGITVLVSYGAYYAYVRFVERRALTELAFTGAPKELGSGVLLGALLFSVTVGVLALLRVYQVSGINHWSVLAIPLTTSIISGFLEEILFRGIIFRIAEEGLGTWLALLISAILFGLLHLGNPNATLVGAVAIIVEAGVLLAATYMLTRRLWLAIGVHFAWNFTQGGIFGVAVSGNPMTGLLQGNLAGPAWLSGGGFGAEASVVAVVLCLAVGLYFVTRAIRQNNIVQPPWRRASHG